MTEQQTKRLAWLAAGLIILASVLVNPVGYIGGLNDDSQYLDAALCWLSRGSPCLAHTHWASRWPVFAPMVPVLDLLGLDRLTVGLAPLVYWGAVLALSSWLAGHWFGWRAAVVNVILLAATPVLAFAAIEPNADVPEICFQLGALAASTLACQRDSKRWAIVAGVSAGLAFLTRETSLIFIGIAGLLALTLPRRSQRMPAWALPGMIATVAAEMLAYWRVTGDPLYRYRLALGHVRIPTDQLPAGFDVGQSPLFNPAYIAA